MSIERSEWSLELSGWAAELEEQRNQLEPRQLSLLIDMVQKLKTHFYREYAQHWDYYQIRAQKAEGGPIELRVVGRRIEVGVVDDTSEQIYIVNVIDSPSDMSLCTANKTILPVDGRDASCFSFLSAQVKLCQNTHSCRAGLDGKSLPTRVILIGPSNEELRILETKGSTGLYSILSYCWGAKDQILKTTSSSLREHLQKIPATYLPKTILDAIEVSRRLSLKYIWIDSLCVLQNSTSDWERESACMGDYYQNAYLTIAASAGSDVDSGFLKIRDGLSDPVEMDFIGVRGMACRAVVQKLEPIVKNLGDFVRNFGPLSERGWTFQENVLSSRVINYTGTGLVWECSESTVLENGTILSNNPPRLLSKHVSDYPQLSESLWRDLVRLYSCRNLTYSSDRLPALSGLAKRFSVSMSSKYLAGLWEQNLAMHLAWKTDWDQIKDHDNIHHIRWQRKLPCRLSGPSFGLGHLQMDL